MDVVVTGSLSYDYIMNFPGRFADRIMPEKIHVLSLSFLVDKLQKQFGGCAVNLAYTLKLLGIEPLIVTAAGNDWLEYKRFFTKYGIQITGIKVFDDEPCSSYHVVTDRDDNQIGAFHIGASRYNKRLSLRQREPPSLVVVGPTDPAAMKKYLSECHMLGYPYFFDPAFQIDNFTPEELRSGIEKATMVIGNDYEIALIEKKLELAHEELVLMVPILVTTLGSKGSIIQTRKEAIHVKAARPKNESDPTGAGDAYRAGFLAGYMRKFDLLVCGQMGSVAAAYTVEKYGTVTHFFTRQQFAERYRENFGTPPVF